MALLLSTVLVSGCGLGQDRVERHLARAYELLEEGQSREALLELRAASQLRPGDPALTLRVAEVAASHGHLDEAIEYYGDAHALDPSDDATTLAYARLLIGDDPERSAALVDALLEREPRHVRALLVKADGLLAAGNVQEARRLVELAQRIEAEDPEVDWSLALVHEARTRAMRARPGVALRDRRTLDVILAAYDRYIEKGGERRVLAALGRARSTGAWTGLRAEATSAYRAAIELAAAEGTPYEIEQVLRNAADYANGIGDRALEQLALQQWVEASPSAISIWQRMAALEAEQDEEAAQATFERMLEHNRGRPAAHVAYARHLGDTRGYGAALAHLEKQLGRGMDDGALLSGLVDLQQAHGRPRDAARTIERIEREFPGRATTALLIARHQISETRYEEAVATLRQALARDDSAEAWRLLARAELARQHHQDALAAIERAIALSGSRSPENVRLKARIHVALGQNRKAADALARLARFERLTPDDRLMMARAYYQSHGAIHGRRILDGLLAGPNPHPKAAVELARWEMDNQDRRPQVLEHLETAYRRHPADIEVLEALTRADLQSNRARAALARVTRAIHRRPHEARLYLIRAHVWLSRNRAGDALQDALRAIEAAPEANDDAYELLARLYLRAPDPQQPIRTIEQRDAAGLASADEIALLARLYLQLGERERARALYERALTGGSDLALLKNDLAYMLAESGEDLERALRLAREATDAPGESLAAADTLGFVYLQSGQYDAAFWQFKFVTEEASPPVAEYWYHLGLALMKLERRSAARSALDEALRIAPDYAPAARAMSELDVAPAPSASTTQPS